MKVWFVMHEKCSVRVRHADITDRYGLRLSYVDAHLYFYIGDTGIADLDEVPDGMEVLGEHLPD